MQNFFKKLTGALKMADEDDLFEKQSDEILQKEKGEVVSEEPSQLPVEEEDEQDNSDGEQDEVGAVSRGEDEGVAPFTIAELARAKTEKKVEPRFSALRIKEEEDREGTALGVSEGQLAIDVYETSSEIVLKSTIAGVKPEDLDIGVEENTVNIRGSRRQEDQVKGDNYFYQECYWGTFSRSVILPTEVDSEKVKASLKDGILTIRLPKIVRSKEKKVQVLAD